MESDLLIVRTGVDKVMYDTVASYIPKQTSSNTITLAVETPGGSPMFAYRVMKLIRNHYEKIFFVVYDMSMSAGTLMSLGSNKIYLASGACLGPLDLQIPHPNDDTYISTIDVRDTAKQTVLEAAEVMRNILLGHLDLGMNKSLAMRSADNIATELYKPIMDKIDPYHLHESLRNAELSIRYGMRLLLDGMISDPRTAIHISHHLTDNYTSHDYAIIEEEARDIGLDVENTSEFNDNTFVRQQYDKIGPNRIAFIKCKKEKGEKQNA